MTQIRRDFPVLPIQPRPSAPPMATPTDLERPSAQRRGAGGSRIVVAGDRGADARNARRHSLKVRLFKSLLPLAALGVVAAYAGAVLETTGWGGAVPNVEMPKILPEHLAIKDPVYEGFDEDGGRYVVRSETAQQDLTNRNRITLAGITGELIDANKSKTNLKAARGTFDGRANQLELFDGIEVDAESGLSARLATAVVRTKEHVIQSQDPVSVTMPSGTVTAKEMTLRQKLREITFVRDVVAHFRPAPAEAGAEKVAQAGKPAAFGASNERIDINANRLDVADATKLAVFSGDVTAVQGAAKLTTPELHVAFEAAADSAKGGVAGAPSMGKVQRVLAMKPVAITQATGERVTSDAAEFDTAAQTALLTGGVTVQAAADRKAVGDRAELDQRTDTVVLTGAVVVTQGRNELKGRRLFHERGSGRTTLSSPAEPRGAAGRITARFYQREGAAPAAKPASGNGDGEAAGGLFGAGFKTDPNAPVDIDAETLEVNDATKLAVFRGEVRAVQGDTVIRTPEMTAHYAGEAGLGTARAERPPGPAAQLTRIEARRKVVVTAKDGQTATGDWADFDVKANTVTLGGEVLLSHGQNTVSGTRLVINMTTGESVLKADPKAGWAANALPKAVANGAASSLQGPAASGRPSAVFYPKQLKEAGKRELPADTSQPRPSGGAATRSN
jgi:lipopolysaccharide transport protein LptA/LPS export ABC transporter protein LptC